MDHSLKTGLSFGLTSATITTLGLMVGLDSGTHSKKVVIGGILVIAIADAFSDALGIHISEEAKNESTTKSIWKATIATFFSKFVFALSFIVPVLFFELSKAIVVSVVYGMVLLGLISYYIARWGKVEPWKVIAEHVFIALAVIIISRYVGIWINWLFG